MTTVFEFSIILGLLIVFFLSVLWLINNRLKPSKGHIDPALLQWLNSLSQTLNNTNSQLHTALNQNAQHFNQTLNNTQNSINKRLDNAMNVFADLNKEVGKMSQLSSTMKDLQLVLQAPKLRGNLGEEILADMLGQVFAKNIYSLQHTFQSGAKVDAVIKTTAGLLPIDAKFPMENFSAKHKTNNDLERKKFHNLFTNDIKKHIKVIASKYILPDEDTVDFAFMYIPSESIFWEVVSDQKVMDFARNLRIYPVSPNTLYIHLQTVLLAFEGQKFEKKAKMVMQLFKTIQKDYYQLDETMQKMGKHLGNTSSQFSNFQQQFAHIGNKLNNTELLES